MMPVRQPFFPPRYLQNAHLQSILNSLGPRKLRAKKLLSTLPSESLILTTDKGVRLAAEVDKTQGGNSKNALVILVHGWEGSSQSAYIVTTAKYLLDQGYDVLRVNLRDHGETQHLNREIFNSTLSEEVADAIEKFTSKHSYPNMFLVGFSLGANFTLRIAADRGKHLGLSAAVAICPPIDPANAMQELNEGLFIYRQYFFRRWTRSLRKKLQYFPEYDFEPQLNRAKTIDELNQFFIPKYTGFTDVKSYFASYALSGDRLCKLAIPAYLIASQDDPITPAEDLEKINCPSHLNIELHRYGGHCGFIQNLSANSWIEPRLTELFTHYLQCG